jgi:hypothetical protein
MVFEYLDVSILLIHFQQPKDVERTGALGSAFAVSFRHPCCAIANGTLQTPNSH